MANTTLLHVLEYNTYKAFIDLCKNKIYSNDLVLHRHHIIPRCLGGDNKKSNIVKLSVEDHVNAHLLLSLCFDENSYEQNANLRSARFIDNKSIKDTEILNKISLSYCGENNPFYGKNHTEETKTILRNATIENRTGINYNIFYGEEQAIIEKQKRSNGTKRVWESRSQEEKDRIIKKVADSNRGKPTWNKGKGTRLSVDNIIFESIKSACEHFSKYKKKLEKEHKVIYL